jgi:hypothetical protein
MARRIRRLSDLQGYPMVVNTIVIKNNDHKDSVPRFVATVMQRKIPGVNYRP